MRIIFHDKTTWEIIDNTHDMLFVRGDGTVWRDNGKTWESQSSVISFDDFVEPCPNIGWGVVND